MHYSSFCVKMRKSSDCNYIDQLAPSRGFMGSNSEKKQIFHHSRKKERKFLGASSSAPRGSEWAKWKLSWCTFLIIFVKFNINILEPERLLAASGSATLIGPGFRETALDRDSVQEYKVEGWQLK
jgi:hypothetical protein